MIFQTILRRMTKRLVVHLRQQKGLVSLALLAVIMQSSHFHFAPLSQQTNKLYDVDSTAVASFHTGLNVNKRSRSSRNRQKQEAYFIAKYDTISLFAFDPNTSTNNELYSLGLTTRQVRIINNYKSKGGSFRNKGDFKKMYSIPNIQYQYLAPYISIKKQSNAFTEKPKFQNNKRYKKDTLFYFDPNTIPLETWQKLGFSAKQAGVIVRYREKGSGFRSVADLQRVQVISEKQLKRISPYIKWSDTALQPDKLQPKSKKVDLNTATQEDLVALRGIGKYYATLILEYRAKLGVFVSTKQLYEILKIREKTIDSVLPFFTCSAAPSRNIFINKITLDQMQQHPYIGLEKAEKLMEYRRSYGFFTSKEQFKKEGAFSPRQWKKIEPYLAVK